MDFIQDPMFNPGLDPRSNLLRSQLSIPQLDQDARNTLKMVYAHASYKSNLDFCKIKYALEWCSKSEDGVTKEDKLENCQACLSSLLEKVHGLMVSNPDFSIFRDFPGNPPCSPSREKIC